MMNQQTQLQIEHVHGSDGSLYRSNVLEEEGAVIGVGDTVLIRPAEIVTIGGELGLNT